MSLAACGEPVRTTSSLTPAPTSSAEPSASEVSPTAAGPTVANGAIAWSRAEATSADGQVVTASIVVREPGDRARVVAGDAAYRTPPSWSSDGAALAYVGDGALHVWTAANGSERVLGCEPPTCLGLGPPAWSPQGSLVALGVTTERTDGLAIIDVTDPELAIVAEVPVDGPPTWSPDGTSIVVASGDRIVVLDAGTGRVTSSVRFGGTLAGRIGWSPDGTTFVLDGRVDGEAGVYLVPVAGGTPHLLTACPDEGCTDLDPSWTPDGRQVVFTRARCDLPGGDCFTGDVFLIDASGGAPDPVATDPALDCCAAVQPVHDP